MTHSIYKGLILFGTILTLTFFSLVSAQETALEVPTLTTYGTRNKTAASEQSVRDRDLQLRPILNPSDIIKVTPGLTTATHAGGGKGYQYFMRGFDIDHGTDLAFWLDGMPINNVSHGHGQGYTDLQFIIPETIDKLEIYKGPYHAEFGDFTTAGALRLRTKQSIPQSFVKLSGGFFNTGRILVVSSLPGKNELRPFIAAEAYRSDGPFDSEEEHERYNFLFKTPLIQDSNEQLFLQGMAYGSGWNASGQIPQRAIANNSLSRWGSIDPTEGGISQRTSLSLSYLNSLDNQSQFTTDVYFIQYRFALYSNFTFFLEDSVNGDQIEQLDRRNVLGFKSEYSHQSKLGFIPSSTILGIQNRNDFINNSLAKSFARKKVEDKNVSNIYQSSLGIYVDQSITPFPWLNLNAGMRFDLFTFDVKDELNTQPEESHSGVSHRSKGSPKANIIVSPLKNWEIYLNYGRGFHSNDARSVVQRESNVTPLATALGYELGTRTWLGKNIQLAADVWRLDLESELVWVGDAGETEEGGQSERMGFDFESRIQILKYLSWDGDFTWSQGIYPDAPSKENTIANSPPILVNTGFSLTDYKGIYGSLRGSFVGDRALIEDESITGEGFFLMHLNLGYRYQTWDFSVMIENLLNSEYAITQFATESRLKDEVESVEEVHFVPGNPFNLQAKVQKYF